MTTDSQSSPGSSRVWRRFRFVAAALFCVAWVFGFIISQTGFQNFIHLAISRPISTVVVPIVAMLAFCGFAFVVESGVNQARNHGIRDAAQRFSFEFAREVPPTLRLASEVGRCVTETHQLSGLIHGTISGIEVWACGVTTHDTESSYMRIAVLAVDPQLPRDGTIEMKKRFARPFPKPERTFRERFKIACDVRSDPPVDLVDLLGESLLTRMVESSALLSMRERAVFLRREFWSIERVKSVRSGSLDHRQSACSDAIRMVELAIDLVQALRPAAVA